MTIGLVVDISGSQASLIGEHRRTVAKFLGQVLRLQDQGFLVALGPGVKLVTDLTHSVQDLQSGVARLDLRGLFDPRNAQQTDFGEPCRPSPPRHMPSGRLSNWWCGTLLWNGLYSSVHLKTKPANGRKALIVLTDGFDAGSSRRLTDVLEVAQSADTAVYTIRYAAAMPAKPPRLVKLLLARRQKSVREGLQRLAEETGGRAFNDPEGDPFKIFDAIERDLRNQYVLAFTMPEAVRDGGFHKLEVKPKRGGVTVRARRGYQAVP